MRGCGRVVRQCTGALLCLCSHARAYGLRASAFHWYVFLTSLCRLRQLLRVCRMHIACLFADVGTARYLGPKCGCGAFFVHVPTFYGSLFLTPKSRLFSGQVNDVLAIGPPHRRWRARCTRALATPIACTRARICRFWRAIVRKSMFTTIQHGSSCFCVSRPTT